MSLGFSALVDEVQGHFGAPDGDDLYGDTRVGTIVNDSIRELIRNHPGLYDVGTRNKTTLVTIGGQYSYDLAEIATADSILEVGTIHRVQYINTTLKDYHKLDPWKGGLAEWDRIMPYLETWSSTTYAITAANSSGPDTITVAEDLSIFNTKFKIKVSDSNANDGELTVISTSGSGPTVLTVTLGSLTDNNTSGTIQIAVGEGMPASYVRRRHTLEIAPVPNNSHVGKELWVEYDRIPNDISTSAVPLITDCNLAIINQAVANCYLYINRDHQAAGGHFGIAEQKMQIRLDSEIPYEHNNTQVDRSP